MFCFFFFFKQKTAYEMRISDWSSDVCSSDLPDVPTIEETGIKNVHMPMWYGVMVPANTPDEVVKKLEQDLTKAITSKSFVQTAKNMSLDIIGSTAEEFKQQIVNDTKTIIDLSKKTKLRH